MQPGFLDHIRHHAQRHRSSRPAEARARDHLAAIGPHRRSASRQMVNLCANNYLGLADHPEIIAAAAPRFDHYGFGMASVRFICGTLDLHRELERAIASYLGKDDAILFAACFDANGGLFETLPSPKTTPSSPMRSTTPRSSTACASARPSATATPTSDMDDLETQLKQAVADGARFQPASPPTASSRWMATSPSSPTSARSPTNTARLVDGRRLPRHRPSRPRAAAARRRSPAPATRRHRHRHLRQDARRRHGRLHRGPQPVIDLLRQRARPYLFSNALAPPPSPPASLKAIEIAEAADDRRAELMRSHDPHFRAGH